MRRCLTYIILGFCLLGMLSCRRENISPEDNLPGIHLKAGQISTKGLLSAGGLAVNGTQIKVYDYISNFTGTIVSGGNTLIAGADGTIKYIDDAVQYNGTTSEWDYVSGDSYPWTRTGTHNFFGWTIKDGNNASLTSTNLFGGAPSFTEATKTLNIPAQTLTVSSTQLDFCYSDIVQKTSSYREAVELPFHHLFTGLSLAIQNASEDVIRISRVETEGIANSKSATICYDGTTAPTPVYTRTAAPSNIIPASIWSGGAKVLTKNDAVDLFTGNAYSSANPYYIIMWPQTWDVDINGSGVETLAGAKIYYTVDGMIDEHTHQPIQYTSTIHFKDVELLKDSATGFLAGHKYRIVLLFEGKQFILKLEVDPWDYVKDDLDYANSTIGAWSSGPHEGALWLYNNKGDNGGEANANSMANPETGKPRVVPITAEDELLGVFYIDTPSSGNWRIMLTPSDAAEYFIITPDNGLINPENHGRTTFTVKTATKTLNSTQTAYFRVLISINNEWRDSDSEFNRKSWGVSRVYTE